MARDQMLYEGEQGHAGRGRSVSAGDQAELIEHLSAIREELLQVARGWRPWVEGRDADRDGSARNLLQYLALRGHDRSDLQDPLIALGLSSLGGSEGHVQASVDAVLQALSTLALHSPASPPGLAPIDFSHSRELLALRTGALLGRAPPGRPTRIMVTMPSEAAGDPALVHRMLVAGMDGTRINCARDGAPAWRAMRDNLRHAEEQTGRRARVVVDLPGPKLRTGPLAPQPTRDNKGEYLRLMILKIETRRAFEHLPGMLLAALGGDRAAGVMIARGDLAVECGYQRLAEVQEEILWLCQAAHLPVIWATQVLDRLAKTGRPSRAEITDAAMGVQAECVMLNKGPRILEAISVLDDILRRMERHHRKKRPLLPRLRASDYVHTKR